MLECTFELAFLADTVMCESVAYLCIFTIKDVAHLEVLLSEIETFVEAFLRAS